MYNAVPPCKIHNFILKLQWCFPSCVTISNFFSTIVINIDENFCPILVISMHKYEGMGRVFKLFVL